MKKILRLIAGFRIRRLDAKISRLDKKYKKLLRIFECQYKEVENFYVSGTDPFSMILLRDLETSVAELRELSRSITELEVKKVKIAKQLEQ